MKWYLSGPMSGYPQFNFPAFDEAARILRAQGFEVVSPAELDRPEVRAEALGSSDGTPTHVHGTWGDFLSRDVKIVADEIDGLIMLPRWQESRGAKLEAYVGILCQKKFMFFSFSAEGLTIPSADLVWDGIRP